MTVTERPLYGRVDLQRYIPNIVEHPTHDVYFENFETGNVGWTASAGRFTRAGTTSGVIPFSGSFQLVLTAPSSPLLFGAALRRTVTGLLVGKTYTVSARGTRTGTTGSGLRVGVTGDGVSDWKSAGAYTKLTYSFVATATSHQLFLEMESNTNLSFWDEVRVVEHEWAEELPGVWVNNGLSDATGLSFRRGGSRTGIGTKTDVGLMSFTLHNAEDPLNGGTIQPGQIVRAVSQDVIEHPEEGHWEPGPTTIIGNEPVVQHPAVQVYSYGFESGLDGWQTPNGAVQLVTERPSGTHALNVWTVSVAPAYTERLLSGLVVGANYTVKAWVASYNNNDPSHASIRVPGLGMSTVVTTTNSNTSYTQVQHTFTAASTDHFVWLYGDDGSDLFWDDITLTRNEYSTGGDPIYGPGPDVWVVDEEAWTEYVDPSPLFTGRVVDIKSTYPLDKSNGKERISVVVTVADAVNIHGSTMRYGIQIAEGFETFESRINRLASTALAPIEVPVQGAPREVYSF